MGPSPDTVKPETLVKHIPAVGILLIVQGAMEILASLFVLLYGLLYGALATVPLLDEKMAGEPGSEGMALVFGGAGVIFTLGAIAVFALGCLKVVAGFFNHRYRKRTLGLVALGSGFISIVTCYCAPTAVALAIYGLVVYLNEQSIEAFAMGESGMSSDDILRASLDHRPGPYR